MNPLTNRRGSILVLSAFVLIPLIGICALAFDLGFAYTVNTSLERSAALAALSGFKIYFEDRMHLNCSFQAVFEAAQQAVSENAIPGQAAPLPLQLQDVEGGYYNYQTKTFTSLGQTVEPDADAIRVTVRTDPNAQNSFFGRLLSVPSYQMQRQAISTITPYNVILGLAVSNTGDDMNYPPAVCPTAKSPYDKSPPQIPVSEFKRNFRYAARSSYDAENCLGGGPPRPLADIMDGLRNYFYHWSNEFYWWTGFQNSFFVFGTTVESIVPFGTPGDVDLVANALSQGLTDFVNYANSKAASPPYSALKIAAGGRDPTGADTGIRTGFTNTARAIQEIIQQFSALPKDRRAFDMALLITYSPANCSTSLGCGTTQAHLDAAALEVTAKATGAAANDVMIHTIYYDGSSRK